MSESYTGKKRVRKNFGRIEAVSDMPNLIDVQTVSYNSFINNVDNNGDHCEFGLEEVFKSIFPIKDYTGAGELEFVKYELDAPKYDVEECIKRDMTYAAPIRATLRLVVFDVDETTGTRSIHDIKEQDVFMGDIPLMTDKGTFIFNGTERVVVSQMHRSPGVFFDSDGGKTISTGKKLFSVRIIPYRGSWLDFEFDAKDLLYARIDRKRKLPATTILYSLYSKETEQKVSEAAEKAAKLVVKNKNKAIIAKYLGDIDAKLKEKEKETCFIENIKAMETFGKISFLKEADEEFPLEEIKGMDKEEILSYFYETETYIADKKNWKMKFEPSRFKGVKFDFAIVNAKNGETVWDAGKKLNFRSAQKLADDGLEYFRVTEDMLYGKFLAKNIVNEKNGEVLAMAGDEINAEVMAKLNENKIKEIETLYVDNLNAGAYIRNTLAADKAHDRKEALADVYRVMRPGEPATYEAADELFGKMFYDEERYDLSSVGRVKMNASLDIPFSEAPDTIHVLRKDDILRIIKKLVNIHDGKGNVDDIDHLGNRRVRSVGELMENQYRMGLLRMERAIREKMSSESLNNAKPQDLVNAKPIASVIREFFGSSQLSQFMDQNNPLSEITHKRRLSALGPGGLSRDRAGFEVRDVHPTHYGRICPIESPEGPNIGLINSLSSYARVNKYGFIECPYRKVIKGTLTAEVEYLSADDEGKVVIAEANAKRYVYYPFKKKTDEPKYLVRQFYTRKTELNENSEYECKYGLHLEEDINYVALSVDKAFSEEYKKVKFPYFKVEKGVITDKVEYVSAENMSDKYFIVVDNGLLDDKVIKDGKIVCYKNGVAAQGYKTKNGYIVSEKRLADYPRLVKEKVDENERKLNKKYAPEQRLVAEEEERKTLERKDNMNVLYAAIPVTLITKNKKYTNRYSDIKFTYQKAEKSKITNKFDYLSLKDEIEKNCVVIENLGEHASLCLDEKGNMLTDLITCRRGGEVEFDEPNDVNYIDVSPKQLVSVAAALIPFLENDDANRALMGSNMQRQGVPLLRSEAPLVGTGIEATVAKDSGATLVAKYDGVVDAVDANRIVIRTDGETAHDVGVEIYRLSKFRRSNQNTCINQVPLVKVGDHIKKGDIIADGPCTNLGELALGKNLLVAFMPWNGLNYEDAILLSERISRDDVLTSLHIEEFEVMARDTKLGQEEITRDIPNVGEEALRNLDEAGIVYVGAHVKAGDILVGKVTPKGESPVTPEEKLLRAIFGEKASDVRDTSLRAQPGVDGIVVDVHIFSRRGVEKDERALAIEQEEISALAKDRDDETAIIRRNFEARMRDLLVGQTVQEGPRGIVKNSEITDEILEAFPSAQWRKITVKNADVMDKIEELSEAFDARLKNIQDRFENKVEKVQRGDDLLPGVLKKVKVYIATKRKMQTGDKMAGRHGNKGTVSRVLPLADMPYTEDGTPVDVVLNPLGVPSRMNVGQILETHLGWAAKELGIQLNEMCEQYKRGEKTIDELNERLKEIYGEKQFKNEIATLTEPEKMEMIANLKNGIPMATPVFDGASGEDINNMLKMAGLPTSGQIDLYDGRTGEKFDRKVTVGVMYMIKLHHIVDEKMHARSVGPYSLVTQQPLGGKAQFGGQRFGEMEVWALQAYGAAYTLQEMLTIKSDDVAGRTKVYEAIVRGEDSFNAGVPESFNVLVKEIKSLCLNIEMLNEEA